MIREIFRTSATLAAVFAFTAPAATAQESLLVRGEPSQLDVRVAGEHSVRVTLKPISFQEELPFSPSLAAGRAYPQPTISLREISDPVTRRVGNLQVTVRPQPLSVEVRTAAGEPVQTLVFAEDGTVSFDVGPHPVLGMGEGGPEPGDDWRTDHVVEFDRRGRFHQMRPRWQSNAYGSRNPVALLVGTEGWGLYVGTPWVQVDLREPGRGTFTAWERPAPPAAGEEQEGQSYERQVQGRPPAAQPTDVFDAFVFDAHDPAAFMKDVSYISGAAVMPPKWALGYMQSHRELRDDERDSEALLTWVVDTFREKRMPLDAVIYLGTGFTPTGWNTRQPSFDFNPKVFQREPPEVLADLHARNVRIITHHRAVAPRPACHAPRDGSARDGRRSRPVARLLLLAGAHPARARGGGRLVARRRRLVRPLRAHQAPPALLPGPPVVDAPTSGPGACTATGTSVSPSGVAGSGREIPRPPGRPSRPRSRWASTTL